MSGDRYLQKLINDALQAVDKVRQFVDGYDLDGFVEDRRTYVAVERHFVIIGEVINRLRHRGYEPEQQISSIRQIVAFRNILVHGYDLVDDHVVWRIIQEGLPVLRQEF